jgi:dipeptidyl-peptidase 4
MRRRLVLGCVAFALAWAPAVRLQTGPPALPPELDARLKALFGGGEFAAQGMGPMAWLDSGSRYTAIPRGSKDIMVFETATGAGEVLVPASALTPPGAAGPLDVDDYAWSGDRSRLLVFTNTRRVWRRNTRGDYWVLDREARKLRKLGGPAPESSLMYARFSPDGTRVAYVRARNLYVETLASGAISAVTTDGGGDVVNGTSDWVNEEEFSIRDGFRWSPDGRRLAFWQFDTTGVERFTLINNTDALYPSTTVFPYPKPGTVNSAVRVGIADLQTGAATWVKTDGDPRDNYIPRMAWADAQTLVLQHMNRQQNRNDLLLADATTGDVRCLFRDESATWLDTADPVEAIDGGREFTWVSEKSGWRHVHAVARADGRSRDLTPFEADILDVAAVDTAGQRLYVTASPQDATQRYLFAVRTAPGSRPARITPVDLPGWHSYDISPDARWAVHTWSRFDTPPQVDIVSLPAHRRIRMVVDNAALAARVTPLVTPPVEFVKLDVGEGVSLDGWVLKPRAFDPAKKYPLFVHVYGEPASTTVTDRWGGTGMLFHRALADQGYVVASFDNRGTPAPKGAAWRKVVYGAVGELSAKEQAAAVASLAATRPFIDLSRVGIWGWSGGGSNTLNAMFRYPEVYSVGISVAPVPDQRLYDTIYQERYMGLPGRNTDGYRRGSPITFADGLRGRLLVVHGTGDDNVHYQGVERLINRLVELEKQFDVMVYPNRSHSISEGPGTSLHVRRLVARYLLEHLPPGPR